MVAEITTRNHMSWITKFLSYNPDLCAPSRFLDYGYYYHLYCICICFAGFGPRDCSDIRASGDKKSGVYVVYPGNISSHDAASVYCDMNSSESWLVIIVYKYLHGGSKWYCNILMASKTSIVETSHSVFTPKK